MRYQIQKYNLSDFNDRQVVAEHTGLMNDTDLQEWVASEIAKQEPSETHKFVPVPENHEWFKHDEPGVSIASATADTSVQSSNVTSMESAPVEFQTVAQYELKRSQEQRKASMEALLKR